MLFQVKITERICNDPQEKRAMAKIRQMSIEWLTEKNKQGKFLYVFRNEDNYRTYIFLDVKSNLELHLLLDADPLISYSTVSIEPLLTPIEAFTALEDYLGKKMLGNNVIKSLDFSNRKFDENAVYKLYEKEMNTFSPLLPLEEQNKVHTNTLISQKRHDDPRELVDFNPVARPIGILIMKAKTVEEGLKHISEAEIYPDTTVTAVKLLTLKQAQKKNLEVIKKYNVGVYRK